MKLIQHNEYKFTLPNGQTFSLTDESAALSLASVFDDAERYRWIRDKDRCSMVDAGVDLYWYGTTENLDAKIDAAIIRERQSLDTSQ